MATKKPAVKKAPISATHAVDALHAAIPDKSAVDLVTKGDLLAWAERIALVAVEKAVGA